MLLNDIMNQHVNSQRHYNIDAVLWSFDQLATINYIVYEMLKTLE